MRVSTIKIHLLLVALFILAASSTYAAMEVVESTGVNLSVDYHDFDRNSQTTLSKTVQFTVRNTGTENITVQTALSGLPSGYSAGSVGNTLVTAGGTATISFILSVPHQKSSGTETIGTIVLSDTAGVQPSVSVPLVQNTKSMLELNEVRVDYTDEDDESQRDEFDKNDREFDLENKVLIGTEVSIKFDVKNLFHKDYDDGTLEDIELSFDVDDDDLYQEEIDDEYSFEDVDSDEEGTLTVTFTVSEEAETKDYDIEITLQADDGNNAVHKVERTLTLTVERKRDDVRITKAVIAPAAITACDSSFTLDATIRNLGKSRQRNVVFSIFNQRLGLDVKEGSLELDPFDGDDDTFSKKFTFPLRNPPVGKQTLTLKVANDKQLDSQPLDVNIGACAASVDTEEEETAAAEEEAEEDNQEITGIATGSLNTGAAAGTANSDTESTAETITSSAIVETIENPWTKEDMFTGLFIIAIILTLVVIIILFIILLK